MENYNLMLNYSCYLGVSWVDMHLLSNRVMLQELLNAGILQGNVDDMMKVF